MKKSLQKLLKRSYQSIHIKNGTVITLSPTNNSVLKSHSIIINDGKISQISPTSTIKDSDFDKTIDANGKIIMPGFINSHMHFYSSFARGLGKAEPSKNFPEILNNLWWRLDKQLTVEDSYYSAMIAVILAIKAGTTTIIDHHASPYHIKGSLNAIADCINETGVRASLCYEVSDRDGPERALEGLQENAEFIQMTNELDNDFLKGLFGLHASFTIENDTLKAASELGKKLNTGFHIHCAEDISDQLVTLDKFGKRVIERLYDNDILGEKTICGHCIHLEDSEYDLLKETDTIVVHNPQSNMNNAVGVANLLELDKRDILVGLGTDAMTNNMMEELRSALWIQHLFQEDPSVGFMEVANTLTVNNGLIAERFWGDIGIGELKEGGVADLVLMEYHPPTQFDETTFLGHLIFGISQHNVDTTICDGKILMEDGKLTMIDEEKIMGEAMKLSEDLWERF